LLLLGVVFGQYIIVGYLFFLFVGGGWVFL